MNYLIYGVSYKLIDEELNKIIGSKNSKSFRLDKTKIEEILEDISYNSMFDEEKIVILKNFEIIIEDKNNNEILEKLINYFNNQSKSTMLIFISSIKLNEKAKVNKEFLSHVEIINTPIISKSYELANYLKDIFKNDGYGISMNALNIFSSKCASNIDIALSEFDKLKNIKGNDRLISEQDIEMYVPNYNTNDIFEFKDSIINKNIEKSLRMIDDMEASKMEIVPIVVMLAKEYETLYNVKSLSLKRMTNDEIGQKLGNMHPYRVKVLREVSNKYKLDELESLLLYLCNLNLKIVSEDNLGFDELRKFLLML